MTNASGRVYRFYPCSVNNLPNWCSKVVPVTIQIDDTQVDFYANRDRYSYVYFRYLGTAYFVLAKDPSEFDVLGESELRITHFGRRGRSGIQRFDGQDRHLPSRKPENRVLTRADIAAVVAYLPELRESIAGRENDLSTAPYEYSEEFSALVRSIVNEFHKRPFMFAFDYTSWMDDSRRLMEDRRALAAADLETIRKLLVVHWRSDYWDSNNEHWEYIAATGHLTALLERLEDLAKDMETSQDNCEGDGEDAAEFENHLPDDTDENIWPTVEELMAGFDRIRDKITPQQLKMLQVNYHSGGRAVTMRELAKATGYGDYKVANIQYGGLAKKLYKAIGYPAQRSRNSDSTFWVLGLGDFVDRSEFGLEMQCVMRPEVAEALERLEIVEKKETEVINDELLDSGETAADSVNILEENSEIQDFIVYHNPDAMGPLRDEPSFEVFTNKSVSKAGVGDRVWLITGEGTPRQFYLACWFYIDEFQSGGDLGFKHCVSGSEGEAFSPFVEIPKDEWFTQLKQDQGNFAFGFNQICTPEAIESLKRLAGILETADGVSTEGRRYGI